MGRTRVFFDIGFNGTKAGRVVFEVGQGCCRTQCLSIFELSHGGTFLLAAL